LLALLACASPAPDTGTVRDDSDGNQAPFVSFADGEPVSLDVDLVLLSATVGDPETPRDLSLAWRSNLDGPLDGPERPLDGFATLRTTLSVGVHTVTLDATDPQGATGSDSVEITVHSAPTAPEVALSPASPTADDVLVVQVLQDAVDPDGASVTYRYAWSVDGQAQPDLVDDRVQPNQTLGAQEWSVQVFADDGWAEGPPGEATVTVANRPPGPPVAAVTPDPIAAGAQGAVCAVESDAVDPDGHAVTYSVAWTVDGQAYPGSFPDVAGPGSSTWADDTVPAVDTDLGEVWTCALSADDGLDVGEPGLASADTVSWVAVGNPKPFSSTTTVKGGFVIATPVTLSRYGDAFAVGLTSRSDAVDVRLALYADSGGPSGLIAQTEWAALQTGDNLLALPEQTLAEGTYWLALQLSDDAVLPYTTSAEHSAEYQVASGRLPDPMQGKELVGQQFNIWLLVKDD
jgi:hypothetical protein